MSSTAELAAEIAELEERLGAPERIRARISELRQRQAEAVEAVSVDREDALARLDAAERALDLSEIERRVTEFLSWCDEIGALWAAYGRAHHEAAKLGIKRPRLRRFSETTEIVRAVYRV